MLACMADDRLDYQELVREALRDVVRRCLEVVAEDGGLPGDHFFYVSFRSNFPGVRIPAFLRDSYPDEVTIILQHQFWDLTVLEDRFEVGLSFGGIPERLIVPFSAIKSFLDPSVKFGLQFDTSDVAEVAPENLPAAPAASAVAVPAPATEPAESTEQPTAPNQGGAEVVRLDRFRKK